MSLPSHSCLAICFSDREATSTSGLVIFSLGTFESPMKTLEEIEAAICDGISWFEQDYIGRGPKSIHAYLIDDLLLVRLTGVLTVAEHQLAASLETGKGRDLIKQVRIHLIETARPVTEAMVTGSKVVSVHHDISTLTGEEVVVFTLVESPLYRSLKR